MGNQSSRSSSSSANGQNNPPPPSESTTTTTTTTTSSSGTRSVFERMRAAVARSPSRYLLTAGFLGFYAFNYISMERAQRIPANAVIYFNLKEGLTEGPSVSGLLPAKQVPLSDMVLALELAKDDPRVKGVVANLSYGQDAWATAQELREAIQSFREASKDKKFTFAFADSFAIIPYYLATAFKAVFLIPSGSMEFTNMGTQSVFLKHTLEKLGIKPQLEGRHEYKNAINTLTEDKYTHPQYETTYMLLDSIFSQFRRGIAAQRSIPEEEVQQLADKGSVLANMAMETNLVDGVLYKDQVVKNAMNEGNDARLISLKDYLFTRKKETARLIKKRLHKPRIALIFGTGTITSGAGNFGSEKISHAIRDAVKDPNIKAIVLRINSGGGDYVASDKIRRAIELAQEAGKPVIASFGDVAASGAYFIAAQCNRIISQPATVTGSIGVFSGKVVFTEKFWDRLGVTFDEMHFAKNSNMMSLLHDFTEDQMAQFNALLDSIYLKFTQHVSEKRKLSLEQIDRVARGRVWSGKDALEVGLVDELGGLRRAISIAREMSSLPDNILDAPVKIFPPPLSGLAALLQEYSPSSDAAERYDDNEKMPMRLRSDVPALLSQFLAMWNVLRELRASNAHVFAWRPAIENSWFLL